MLWLAVVLPELPLQVLLRAAPADTLLALKSEAPARILAASPAALAAGVRRGQGVAAALALAPGLHVRARSQAQEEACLVEAAGWAGRFTSRIRLAPPDALLLEISSSLRLFGGVRQLEAELLALFAEAGLQAHLASAPTALAARWFACCGRRPHTDWQQSLDALPLEVLAHGAHASPAALELLASLGARTLGQARALPAAGLARRQAGMIHDALARARGEIPDPGGWFEPAPTFRHGLVLPFAATAIEPLLFASRRLFASLATWLQARHAAVDHCRLVLEHEARADTVVDIVFGTPGRDPARLALVAQEKLAALQLKAPVCALRLESDAPVCLPPVSTELFGGSDQDGEAGLLLDRLRARLGSAAVRQLQTRADHRPEAATRTDENSASGPGAAFSDASLQRPFWLLAQPQALDAHRFRLLSEAERIESGWWDGACVRRDYYLAEHEPHLLCWVFQELDAPQRWFLHGYFG